MHYVPDQVSHTVIHQQKQQQLGVCGSSSSLDGPACHSDLDPPGSGSVVEREGGEGEGERGREREREREGEGGREGGKERCRKREGDVCVEGGRERRGEICVCIEGGKECVCETSSTGVLVYITTLTRSSLPYSPSAVALASWAAGGGEVGLGVVGAGVTVAFFFL